MSRFTISRLWAPELVRPLSQTLCPATSTVPQWTRLFSQSHAASNVWTSSQPPAPPKPQAAADASMNRLIKNVLRSNVNPNDAEESLSEKLAVPEEDNPEPYHFHIFSHKHNTHITVTKPNRDALISLSCGNLGFRKSARGSYDSAYQLGAYVIDKMHQKGLVRKIAKLEIVLRGFGQGREAVVKVLMGNEGKMLRPKVTRVADATRVKFGGTRSKKKRRLG